MAIAGHGASLLSSTCCIGINWLQPHLEFTAFSTHGACTPLRMWAAQCAPTWKTTGENTRNNSVVLCAMAIGEVRKRDLHRRYKVYMGLMAWITWPCRLDNWKIRLKGISRGHPIYLANLCWQPCTAKLVTNVFSLPVFLEERVYVWGDSGRIRFPE